MDSENVVREISKKSYFRGCFEKEYGKRGKALLKYPSQTLYHNHRSLPKKFSSKKSLLLTCKILGLLVNALATDEKYLAHHRDNLKTPIQVQLSQKQKTFSQFFAAFLKSTLNFKHFESKDDPHRFCIFEVTDSENVFR